MNATLLRFLSRILIVCIAALPMQAGAGMIGTERAASADRFGLEQQLEARGVSAPEAKARVAAMTDAEVAYVARHIDELPNGGDGAALGLILIIIFLIWRFNFSDQAKAEEARAKPAAKPAPKK